VITVLLISALSVGRDLYYPEMNHPLQGMIKVSSANAQGAKHLGRREKVSAQFEQR
jgi:hypothetical protein